MQPNHIVVTPVLSVCLTALAVPGQNLLRNGSFEGSTLYWHNIDPANHTLVRGGAAVGEYSLRIDKRWVMSAPFVCQAGREFTVSFFVKGDREGQVRVQLPPSAREPGQKARRLWSRQSRQTAKIGTTWRRVSFTGKANVPQSGFWPQPHYMVLIEGSVPLQIDGVTVTPGKQGTARYVPRREVEVLSDCEDLDRYEKEGNFFARGATVRIKAHASNNGDKARDVTLRWQLVDYEGRRPVGQPVKKRVTIPAGKTVTAATDMKLTATGTVLARVTALDGGKELDRSDLPLTSLPYPMGPRRPDPRERFGGSYFGPNSARMASTLGFGWSRWYPRTKWQYVQPDGPDQWQWRDKDLDVLEGLGISAHIVLYGWPKWVMDKTHPLPKDMRWAAKDPRWDDLAVETAWDKYVRATVARYKGRAVVYEIENEPEFDRWGKYRDEYARFTIRTARRIKKTDPKARVMVDNVYSIPSGLNAHLLRAGGGKHIDIISWHDYHEGWLADASAMKRMRARLDEAGGKHIEIWFNEGWAFTNTAVDEPIACTRLTSAQSTNAAVCSVAELTVAGQDKTILFHTGYEQHGMSFWDYSGPGTMLWDWYSYPLPLTAAWNTLAHHIGLSTRVAFIRPEGASFCIFEDLRNGRGVMVAYADRRAEADVAVELPLAGLVAEDAMGNAAPLAGKTLVLSRTGRPVFLYDTRKTSGKAFVAKLEPLDRKHVSFVSKGGRAFGLPQAWEGKANGSSEGNPITVDGKPIWRLDQLWPDDPIMASNYRPLTWTGGRWSVKEHGQGGQPNVTVGDGAFKAGVRGAWGGKGMNHQKTAGLVFIAPQAGVYRVKGVARSKPWEGRAKVYRLGIFKKDTQRAAEIKTLELPRDATGVPFELTVELAAGHELVFLPLMPDWHNATNTSIADLSITLRK